MNEKFEQKITQICNVVFGIIMVVLSIIGMVFTIGILQQAVVLVVNTYH